MAYPRKLLPNRRSMGKRARLYTKNRRLNAVNKIKSAYKSYRGRRYNPRGRLSGDSYMCKKVRVNARLAYNQMKSMTTGGKRFEIYFAPWQNVNVTPPTSSATSGFGFGNLFYHPDIQDQFTSNRTYNLFRLKGMYMEIRRPKQFIDYRVGGQVVSEFHDNLNLPWGSEILHTRDEIQADTTTGSLQPTISNVKWGRTIVSPSTWNEAIDDGSRFKVTYGNYQKRTWKPASAAERKWRFTTPGVELEHSTGGICIMTKDLFPIPYVEGPVFQPDAIMFDIMCTVYVEFKVKI